MKRVAVVLLVLSAATASAERGPWSPIGRSMTVASNRLLTSNLTYLGAFRGPASQGLDFCQCALAYDATGNGGLGTLYVGTQNKNTVTTGIANWGGVLEMTIPVLVNSGTLSALNRATTVQPDTDATEGGLFVSRNGVQGTTNIQGLKVVGSTLYINAATNYDPDGVQTQSFYVRSKTLSTVGSVTGPFGPTSGFGRPTAGYLADIPTAWQARYSGDTLTGLWSENTIESISSGYAAFAFSLADVGPSLSFATLLFYPADHTLGPSYGVIQDGQTDAIWTPAISGGSAAVMPTGYDSIMFFGGKGTGPWCYGTGTNNMALDHTPTGDGDIYCYDPEQVSTHGGHGYPAKGYWWMYDANDLLQVRLGNVLSHVPVPYAYGDIVSLIPTFNSLYAGFPGIRGATYDAVHNRIYIAAQKQDGPGPVFHVFQVN